MEKKSFEETKKKYEEEIARLRAVAQSTQELYQRQYDELKNQEKILLDEYNNKISSITIGIERLRGAYTALADMEEGKAPTLVENGLMKDVEITEEVIDNSNEDKAPETEISDELKEKAKEAVSKAKEKGLITPYEEFAKSELGKETAVKNVDEVISKDVNTNVQDTEILSKEEMEALKKVTSSTDENTPNEDTSNSESEKQINPDEVPDYLKEQYGLK